MRGHLERRGDAWRITIDVGRDPLTGRRRRISRTVHGTKAEAERTQARLIIEATKHRGSRTRTVGALLEAWLDHADLSPNTLRGYRSKLDLYLIPALGTIPARKLDTETIDRFYRALRKKGLAPATIRQTHAILRRACSQAVKWGWLPDNPAAHATPPTVPRRDRDAPTVPQVAAILLEASRDLTDAVLLAVATGARRGELCGLQWADIEGTTIRIRRAISDVSELTVKGPKHGRGRKVTIDPGTVALLDARKARARADALACGTRIIGSSYVLGEEPGQRAPLRPERLTGRFRDAAKRAGITATFHGLRHANATWLLADGIPVRQVSGRLGHASAQMTLDVYAHALEQLDTLAAETLGVRLAEIQRSQA